MHTPVITQLTCYLPAQRLHNTRNACTQLRNQCVLGIIAAQHSLSGWNGEHTNVAATYSRESAAKVLRSLSGVKSFDKFR